MLAEAANSFLLHEGDHPSPLGKSSLLLVPAEEEGLEDDDVLSAEAYADCKDDVDFVPSAMYLRTGTR